MSRAKLVILGTGFGAFALMHRINQSAYDITVISPRNHFLFTPLLPSTTVGTVEFRTVIEPIRPRHQGINFLLGRAVEIDLAGRRVVCHSALDDTVWEQPYDVLVIAVGCFNSTFGLPGVEQHAFFLKEIDDARRIRQALVANLERASLPGIDPAERDRLLHFVSVGAGPTGIRFAGELYDLLRTDLPRSYPHLVGLPRVTILNSGTTVLSAYDALLREYVQREFVGRGVEFHMGSRVEEVTDRGIYHSNRQFLPCGMVLWSAGFAPNPLLAGLGVAKDKAGRIITNQHLQLPGDAHVYALGDCGCPAEMNLPQLAQVAEQQGRYLAAGLNAISRGREVPPFRWKPWGISSFIGGGAAVSDSGEEGAKSSGFWAYQQWRAVTWTQLVSLRSKILVPLDRIRAFLFGRDISRL